MKPCFGYVRVSTQKQGEGVSLEAQKDAIQRFAAQNDITIIKWFEEKQTAAKSGRPIFSAMVKALRAHKAEGLVMHKIDRSARNFRDWARIGELSDAGIDVHFATETLDFRSRGGRLSADIQAVIAADYIRNLKDEIQKGVRGQLERGLYPLKAPIGYLNNGGGKLKTLDPVRAPLVKTAFELYASGQYSTRTLRLELNRRGLTNHSGRPISKGCLEKFLKNPFYTGVIRIRCTGAVYQGAHESLITAQLFETVQHVRAGKSGKKVTRHNHTYRGLFHCASCGKSMIPENQKGHVYYRCQVQDCPSNCIREERLEEAIVRVLEHVKISDKHITVITEAVERWGQENRQTATATSYAMQLEQNEQRLEKLTDALIDEIIDKETFSKRKERLLLAQTRLRDGMKDHGKKRVQPAMVQQFLERIKNLAQHYISASSIRKREIVDIATSNRRVVNKNVYIEPSNWLIATEQLLSVFSCAQSRPTSRRRSELRKQQLAALAELAQSDAAEKIEAVFADKHDPLTMEW